MWVGVCIRECVCRGVAHIRLCYAISVLQSDELASLAGWLNVRTYMRILNDAPGRPSGSTVNGVSHHRIICGWDGGSGCGPLSANCMQLYNETGHAYTEPAVWNKFPVDWLVGSHKNIRNKK